MIRTPTSVNIHIVLFWVMTTCNPVDDTKNSEEQEQSVSVFGVTQRWRQFVPSKRWHPPTRLHGMEIQKTATWIWVSSTCMLACIINLENYINWFRRNLMPVIWTKSCRASFISYFQRKVSGSQFVSWLQQAFYLLHTEQEWRNFLSPISTTVVRIRQFEAKDNVRWCVLCLPAWSFSKSPSPKGKHIELPRPKWARMTKSNRNLFHFVFFI
jgi:hypothetical protein